ncbi:RNase J family beta-CASP ribonuclease [Candidatus Woesearchaeota archaeon]|nr:RNase J family beta-CASP ribonuclease [Candidatus Woesearchaeota archaeon]
MIIHAIGGYDEIGKNMTAVEVGDEAVIFDMGIHLEPYIKYTEDEDMQRVSVHEMRQIKAIPDDTVIEGLSRKVKAIIPSHAHLDHIGAIPYLSSSYKAPIVCTPFTAEVIKSIMKEEKLVLKNRIKVLHPNSRLKVSDGLSIEFINMTHSIPHTVMVALHTRDGTVLYANDFKFDNYPVLGKKPNYERLKELGKEGVKCLICDSTRASEPVKTPSESVAREMMKDVLLGVESSGRAIIVTTFSSHLARLKSIIDIGKGLNRKLVFLGRSLAKYVEAGEKAGVVNFSKEVEIVKYSKNIQKRLKEIQKSGSEKYLLVVTGHQGEPKSTLSKIARGEVDMKLSRDDHVIFSCNIIPSPVNKANRKELEDNLHRMGVRIFRDIHVSGHAAREDLRDLLSMVNPMHLVPAHGEEKMKMSLADLAMEKGYKLNKNVHILSNGSSLNLK